MSVATPSQTVGPFFGFGLTTNPKLGRLAAPETSGDRIRLLLRVLDGDGAPVPDAVVELWQVDAGSNGLFGRLPTDAGGSCTFETIRPNATSGSGGTVEAAHINVCLFMRGLLRHIYTRIYFADDPTLKDDPVLALVTEDRRHTLIAHPSVDSAGTWIFNVRLQGQQETVFFDL